MAQRVAGKGAPPFLERIHQQAWQHITDAAVKDIVDTVQLLPARSRLLVIASTDGAEMRKTLLDRIEAELAQAGISAVRISGRRDPFLDGLSEADCILLEEAPLVPHLEAVTREHPLPWIVTTHLREWIREAQGLQPAELYLIPREQLPRDGKPDVQLPADEEARLLHLLVGLDIPLPVSLLTRAGIDVSHMAEQSDQLEVTPIEGVEYLIGAATLIESIEEVLRAGDRAETLLQGLLRIFSAASPEEAGLVVALLRRLALRIGRSLTASVVQRARPALQRLEDDTAPHRRVWAALYSQLGLHQEAREVLEAAVTEGADTLHVQHARAALLAREGSYERALAILRQLRRLYPANVYVLHTTGHVLSRMGQPIEAERILKEALGIEPNNVHVLTTLGHIAAERGEFDDADHLFQEALEWTPGNAVVLNAWAKAKARQGAFDEAIRKLQQAKAIEHWNPRHYVDLAYLLKERGHLGHALEEVRLALEADPYNTHALVTRADIEIEYEEFNAAVQTLNEAPQVEETPHIHTTYGIAEAKRGRSEEAVHHFSRAMRLDKQNVHARIAWANLLLEKGYSHSAADVLQQVLTPEKLPPDSQIVLLNTWAKVHAAWEQFPEATAYLEQAFDLNRHNIRTLNTWGDIESKWADSLKEQGRTEDAEAHYRRAEKEFSREALSLDPENAFTHRACAHFLEKANRDQEALDHLRQAQELGLDTRSVREDIDRLTERTNTM